MHRNLNRQVGAGEIQGIERCRAAARSRCASKNRRSRLCMMSGDFKLQVSTVMGLEALVKQELEELGYSNCLAKNGRVEVQAPPSAIPRLNINLRTANRILLEVCELLLLPLQLTSRQVAEFEACSFDELFDGVSAVEWSSFIPKGASYPVGGKSVDSILHSVPACQSICKKAISASLARGRGAVTTESWVEEDERKGVCEVEVAINKNLVKISIDTSGAALSRRGYRTKVLDDGAPLKETLAAGILMLR
eukprot:154172-Hanusia_phi.AAC.1